jgi:hypothetical protein
MVAIDPRTGRSPLDGYAKGVVSSSVDVVQNFTDNFDIAGGIYEGFEKGVLILVQAAETYIPLMWVRFQEFWNENKISSKIMSLINSFFNVLSNPAVGSYLVAGLTIIFSILALWGQLTGGGFI